ncbi:Slp family lipoprotein [Vibrio panuliri]|uniref:Starvation-inducible protein n=1 Tax=Vibrio panuliri TaxID=1381081 RepID=A0ABX3F3M3_9VIBR|nr:Slp family lipoprotein [Vibrio panuliri]KAB1453943.1 Slp family lipoprotein [Vibrio panuliri]OLQ84008.1 starvation-inducible protein [Vibrio panuliri]
MKDLRFVKLALCSVALLALSACSSLPEQLVSDNPNLISDYATWQQQSAVQNEVRMGGVIAEVENLADRTRIEVVNLPIDSVGKPDIGQEPNGRFVAYLQGFEDPVAFAPGRLITFLGESNGSENGKVGEFDATFPVMNARGYRLWRVEERIIINDPGSYVYPCRTIYCRDNYYNSRQGRVIKDVR